MTVPDFATFARGLPPCEGRVRHVREGDLARIVLDAPATRNALHPRMMLELAEAVDAARGARFVLLTGAGGTFCAGGDLRAVREHLAVPGMGRAMGTFMHGVLDALEALGAPVLAVVDGPALGGGAELLAACDVVFAGPRARVGWVQAQLGVSPGFGGGARLVRRVGASRATRLLLEARVLTAQEGHDIGLIDVLDDAPAAAAQAWIDARVVLSDAALRATIAAARPPVSRDALARELDAFDAVWGSPAHRVALEDAWRRISRATLPA